MENTNKINVWAIIGFIGNTLALSFLVPGLVFRFKHDDVRATKFRRIGHCFNLVAAVGQIGSIIYKHKTEEKEGV